MSYTCICTGCFVKGAREETYSYSYSIIIYYKRVRVACFEEGIFCERCRRRER